MVVGECLVSDREYLLVYCGLRFRGHRAECNSAQTIFSRQRDATTRYWIETQIIKKEILFDLRKIKEDLEL